MGVYLYDKPDAEVWQEAVTILQEAGQFEGSLNLFKKLCLSCKGLDLRTLSIFLEVACIRLGCEAEVARRSWSRSIIFCIDQHTLL